MPAPGAALTATGVEWRERPAIRGFRPTPTRDAGFSARPSVLVLRSCADFVERWHERLPPDSADARELAGAARELRRRAAEAARADRPPWQELDDDAENELLQAGLLRMPRS